MTELCSTKRATGSVFYPCLRCRRDSQRAARRTWDTRVCARKAFQCRQLEAISRRRSLLDGRRFVPPDRCRQMNQPWRERPPSSARTLTLGAPPGVVHATAASSERPARRHGDDAAFERANLIGSQRVRASIRLGLRAVIDRRSPRERSPYAGD